jgi:hypothetical protein
MVPKVEKRRHQSIKHGKIDELRHCALWCRKNKRKTG